MIQVHQPGSPPLLHRQEVDFQVFVDIEEESRFDQEATQHPGLSPPAFNLPPDEL